MRELCFEDDPDGYAGDAGDASTPSRKPTPLLPQPSAGNSALAISISNLIAERARSKAFFWSVELIPGTNAHLQTQLERSLESLSNHKPAFASVTWHVEHLKMSDKGETLKHPALDLGNLLQRVFGIPVLMHLAAGKMKQDEVLFVLKACLEAGIKNILALRGDDILEDGDFKHASDLVTYIRTEYGSKFDIGVAGYPSGHTEAESAAADLLHLRDKVNAGADFIFTQLITTCEEFDTFKQNCEMLGIRVPIIPGVYLIQSFSAFNKFLNTCSIKVPQKNLNELQDLNDKQKEMDHGAHLFQHLIKSLQMAHCPGIHIFTINRVSRVLEILSGLGLCGS